MNNTQGITIPIQARIEGWQAELKRIQDEAKKIDLGSALGKDLTRYISTLEKQVNAMGKSLTQRFTSDAAIDRFGDKIGDIEERFSHIGQILSGIQFGDLDAEYVASQLNPLINQVDKLQEQLNSELDVKWSENIVNEAAKIQKAFARIGQSEEDIKNLGREGTRSVLEEMVTSAIKQADEAAEKIKNLQHNIAEFKKAEQNWQPNAFAKEINVDSYISSVVSKDPASYGFKPLINEQALEETKKKIENSINEIKLSETKKEEIRKYLNDLVSTNSVELIRKRIGSIKQILKGVVGRDAFGLDADSLDKAFNDIINKIDPSVIDGSLNRIKERFLADGITEEDLNKFWGSFSDSIKNQDFDKAIDILSTNLTALQEEYKKGKDKITAAKQELETALKQAQGDQFRAAWTRTFGEEALKELDALIAKYTEASETAKQLNKAQKDLDQKSKDLVNGPKDMGKGITAESSQRYKELITEIQTYKAELAEVQAKEQMLGKIQGVAQRWFSIYAAVRMVENAIKSVISTVTELDSTITEIAIVTDMGQDELWRQMPQYTALAQQYAASIAGVYQVSQLYYQQGLDTVEVMELTEQTLKMARISGLDYAQATDYMTNAIRSFKMEMSDAQSIVDVYSAIAAASATDTTELASAMSKTASSAQAVGSSFEDTTAMMAVMIEATRESAENIGSAMKSIISRYGEMTSDPSKLIDSEGEVMSLNRVDTALQTVGITIHDTEGKFRSFSDVIVELAEKWDTIDTNTQRYIATTMAGNRQQSRFLALVSSGDRLNELMTIADESEDASQLQYLKTLDSITAKTQQLQTSLQTLYTDSGIERWYKSLLDVANDVLATFNKMPKVFNLPIAAIANFGIQFYNIASVVTTVVSMIKNDLVTQAQQVQGLITEKTREASEEQIEITRAKVQAQEQIEQEGAEHRANITAGKTVTDTTKTVFGREVNSQTYSKLSLAARAAGTALSFVAAGMGEATTTARVTKGALEGVSGALSAIGYWMSGNPFMAIVSGVMAAVNAIDTIIETAEERAERLSKAAEEANNKRIQSNADYKDLTSEINKLEELDRARHDSEEAAEAYFEASKKIAESMPELVSSYDTEGNAIINLQGAYDKLAEARKKAAEAGQESAARAVDVAANANNEAIDVYKRTLKATLTQALGYDKEGLSSLIVQSGTDNGDVVDTNLSRIANTLRQNENYEDFVESNTELDSFIKAIAWGDERTLYSFYDNTEKLSTLVKQIANIEEIPDNADEGWVDAIQELYNSLFGDSLIRELKKAEGNLKDTDNKLNAAYKNAIIQNTKTRIDEQVLDARYGLGQNVDYLSEFSVATDIINQAIINMLPENIDDINTWLDSDEVKNAYTNIELEMKAWWNSLLPDEQKIYNDLIKNRANFTDEELRNSLSEVPSIFQNAFLDYIKNVYTIEDFKGAISSRIKENKNTIASNFQTLSSKLGGAELKRSLITADKIDKLVLSDQIGKNAANTISQSYVQALTNSNEEVQQLLLNTDIFSFTDVMDLVHRLEGEEFKEKGFNIDPAVNALKQIAHLIPLNINTEAETLVAQVTEGLSDMEKSIKNVTKGMDYKTMTEEAAKLGLETKDFTLKNGKYTPNDYAKVVNGMMEDYNNQFADLITETESRRTIVRSTFNQFSGLLNNPEDFISADLLGITDEQFKIAQEDYNKYAKEAGNTAKGFIDWYFDSQIQTINDTSGQVKNYLTDVFAREALEGGQLETFASLAFGEEGKELYDVNKEAILAAIGAGDISTLTPELQSYLKQYQSLIVSTFSSVQSSIFDSLIAAVGQTGTQKIAVTDANRSNLLELLKRHSDWFVNPAQYLNENGEATLDNVNEVELAAEQLAQDVQTFQMELANTMLSSADYIKKLSQYHTNKYSNSTLASFKKVAGNDTFSFDDIATFLDATTEGGIQGKDIYTLIANAGLTIDSAGNVLVDKLDTWLNLVTDAANTIITDSNTSQEEKNAARALLRKTRQLETAKYDKAFTDIFNNYNQVSIDQLQALADALELDYLELEAYFVNENGTYSIDTTKIQQLLALAQGKVSKAAAESLNKSITTIADDYFKNIQTAANYTTQGASSLADVEAFRQSYADIVGSTLDASMFKYNTLTQSFVLDPIAMSKYVEAQKKLLLGMGYTEEFVNAYITDQTDKAIQASIELDSFLNANTSKERNDEANKLIQQIRGLSNYKDLFIYDSSLIQKLKEHNFDQDSFSRDWEKYQQQYDLLILQTLESGGQVAVDLLKQIKPDASADELGSVYSNAINRLNDALSDAEDFVVGSMVNTTSKLYEILSRVKPENINADGVITAAYDMVEVYAAIYAEMTKTAGATTAGLNDAYAQFLTAQDQMNIDITDALKNGNGMSYADFGKLLANYDIKFEEFVTEHWNTIIRDGFGNIRIADWEGFAKAVFKTDNLDAIRNTDEYISAFKAYNDGLISLNKHVEQEIGEEIKQLESAKSGDWINLTEFSQKYFSIISKTAQDFYAVAAERIAKSRNGKTDTLENEVPKVAQSMADAYNKLIIGDFHKRLLEVGAYMENGILKALPNADVLGIYRVLENTMEQIQAADKDTDYSAQIAEIKDSINSLINNYISSISSGISGSLTNAQANELKSMAASYGVSANSINFTQTAEGLKLTSDAALTLYGSILSTNKALAKQLTPDIMKMSKQYGSLYGIMSAYARSVQRSTKGAGYQAESSVDVANAAWQLEEAFKQLALKDIHDRVLEDPDTYNIFGKHPMNANWQSGFNLSKSAWTAQSYLKQMRTKGNLGMEEFYDFMGVISESDNSEARQWAANMVYQAADALTFDKQGNPVIDMKKLNLKTKDAEKYWNEVFDTLAKEGAKQQQLFVDFFNGSNYLNNNDDLWVKDENGNSTGELTDKAFEVLQGILKRKDNDVEKKRLQGILKHFKDSQNRTLDEIIKSSKDLDKDQKTYGTLIQTLADLNWDAEDVETQVQQKLSEKGIGGTIHIDENGEFVVELGDGKDVNFEFKLGNKSITAKDYQTYIAAQAVEKMKGFTEWKDTGNGVQTSIDLKGATLDVTIDTNGKSKYKWAGTINGNLHEIESDDFSVISAYLKSQGLQGLEGSEELSGGTKHTLKIDNSEINIEIDASGNVKVTPGDGVEIDKEQLVSFVTEYLKSQGLLTKDIEVEINGEKVTITADGSEPKVDEGLKKTITEAITDSISSLPTILAGLKDTIENLDSKPLTDIADAIETIVSATKNLSEQKGIETLNKELGKIEIETLTEVSGALQIIATNLQTLATSSNWLILTVALELINIALSSIDENNRVFDIIKTDIDQLGGDQLLQTVKTTFIQIREALAAIKENSNIKINLDASGAEATLNALTEITKLLSILTGKDFGLNGNKGNESGNTGISIEESSDEQQTVEAIAKITDTDTSQVDGSTEIQAEGKITGAEMEAGTSAPEVEVKVKSNGDIDVGNNTPEIDVNANVNVDESELSSIETTQNITPTGQLEDVPDFETIQTITQNGSAVSGPTSFTTTQYVKTVHRGGCFVAGTKIYMADGTTKNIEDVQINDIVISYDVQKGIFIPGKINKAYVHHNTSRLIRIILSDGNILELTPGHPILSTTGWKSRDIENSLYEHNTIATQLNIGDSIIGHHNITKVIAIEELTVPNNYDTYNAEVDTYHTFIANGIVAHNAKSVTATGNVGLAKAKGTLMGELGPELVVSNGHYFVVGQNGAEMVDLADDAIVFNHLQTEQLLKKGVSNTRGRAIINERKAAAFAKGTGPAMAKAAATITSSGEFANYLKELKATKKIIASAVTTQVGNPVTVGAARVNQDQKAKKTQTEVLLDTVKTVATKFSDKDKIKDGATNNLFKNMSETVVDRIENQMSQQTKAIENAAEAQQRAAQAAEDAARAQEEAARAAEEAAKAAEEAERKRRDEELARRNAERQSKYNSSDQSKGLVHPKQGTALDPRDVAPWFREIDYGEGEYVLKATKKSSSSGGGSSRGSTASTSTSSSSSRRTNRSSNNGNMVAAATYANQEAKKVMGSGAKSISMADLGGDDEDEITLADLKSAISNFISDMLSKGLESIDLDDYEKLTPTVKANIENMIANGASYREFITAYAGALNKSMKEVNQLYFEAWQKDLEAGGLAESQMDAVEGLNFYSNGSIGGSSSDWTEIFGNWAYVEEAVKAGVLQWSASLRQYIVTNEEALLNQLGTNGAAIFNWESAKADNSQKIWDEIRDALEKAMTGEGLTNKEADALIAQLKQQGIVVDKTTAFLKGTDGKLKLFTPQFEAIDRKIRQSQEQINQLKGSPELLENNEQNNEKPKNTVQQKFSHIKLLKLKDNNGVPEIENLDSINQDLIAQLEHNDIAKYMAEFEDVYYMLADNDKKTVDAIYWALISRRNELMKQGNFTDTDKYREFTNSSQDIKRIQEISDLIVKSLNPDTPLIEEEYNRLLDLSEGAGIRNINLKQGSDGFTGTFQDYSNLYEQIFVRYPQIARRALKSIDNSLLNGDELEKKADMLVYVFDNAGAASIDDEIIQRNKNALETIRKGFGENNFIDFESFAGIEKILEEVNLTKEDIGAQKTSQGWTVSFEGLLNSIDQFGTDIPATVQIILEDILENEKDLTDTQISNIRGIFEKNKLQISSSKADDLVTNRANDIVEKALTGFKEGSELTNEQYQEWLKNLENHGLNIDFDTLKNNAYWNGKGIKLTSNALLQLINGLWGKGETAQLNDLVNGMIENGELDIDTENTLLNALSATEGSEETISKLKDSQIARRNSMSEILNKGFTTGSFMTNDDFETLKKDTLRERMEFNESFFEQTSEGIRVSFDGILAYYNHLQKESPEQAKKFIKNLDISNLTPAELSKIAGDGLGEVSAFYKDTLIEGLQKITEGITNGFGKDKILSFQDFDNVQKLIKQYKMPSLTQGIDFKVLENGVKITQEGIQKVYENISKQSTEEAKKFIKNLDKDSMSIAELKEVVNLNIEGVSSEYSDKISEIIRNITETAIKGFGEKNQISYTDFEEFNETLKKEGMDSLEGGTDYTDVGNGIRFTFNGIQKIISGVLKNNIANAKEVVSEALDSADISKFNITELTKLIEEALAIGDERLAAKFKDEIINRRKSLTEIISKGYGQGNYDTFEGLEELKKLYKDTFNLELSGNFYKTSKDGVQYNWDLINDIYTHLLTVSTEEASKLLKSIDNDILDNFDLTSKARMLERVGNTKDAAEALDKIVERKNNIVDLLTKGIEGTLTESDLDKLGDELEKSNKGLGKDYVKLLRDGLKVLSSGMQLSLEQRRAVLSDVIQLYPEYSQEIVEAYNSSLVKDIQESTKATSGAIRDAASGLTYISDNAIAGTLSDFEELANAAGIALDEILDNAEWSEELQKYVVSNKDAISGIDWSKIENIPDIIYDGINEFLDSLTDTIKKGISGTLTKADLTSITGMLAQRGFGNVQLDFKKTTEGLKLSEQSAIRLYTILRQVDAVHARLVFNDLNESLRESNDHYNSIQTTVARIAELKEKIAQAEARKDNTKINQYQEELALAKQILQVRATEEDDSMNFMDQELPGSLKNPLNYTASWTKAMQAWREALTPSDENTEPGFLGYQNFYNIAKQLNEQAAVTGKEIEFAGVRLNGSMETFSRLLEKGSDALVATDTGEIKVSLKQMGIDLESGFDEFGNVTTDGMRDFAKSQVELLDGMIQFLETIVALQELNNLDEDGNGIVEMPDIFSDESYEVYSDKYTNSANRIMQLADSAEHIKEAFESVKIKGYTIYEILNDAKDGFKDIGLSAEEIQAVINSVLQLANSNDWDLDHIGQSLQDQLSALTTGDIDIEFGDTHIRTIKGKIVLEKQVDGKTVFSYDGKDYNSLDEIYNSINQKEFEELKTKYIPAIKVDESANVLSVDIKGLATFNLQFDSQSGQYLDLGANNTTYPTWDAFVEAKRQEYNNLHNTELGDLEFRLKMNLIPEFVGVDQLTDDQINKLKAAGLSTSNQVEQAWGTSEESHKEFVIKYGFALSEDGVAPELKADLDKALADETKAVNVVATFSGDSDSAAIKLLNGETPEVNINLNADTTQASTKVEEFTTTTGNQTATIKVDADTSAAKKAADDRVSAIDQLRASIQIGAADNASSTITSINEQLNNMVKKVTIEINKTIYESTVKTTTESSAKENASAKGNALAAGSKRTLMGELGPELYVTNGHYFVAGQNGAEFVDLPADAIVFNHLQTQNLMNGGFSTRGKAITSEAVAVSMARGNSGPAMASANAALAHLKALRAMWASIANMTTQQLAGKASTNSSSDSSKEWIDQVERWYNLLQKIARLEKEINQQEAIRNKLASDLEAHGDLYYKSQLITLDNYTQQAETQKQLAKEQEEYFYQRRAELNSASSPFSQFYTYDEFGQLKYKEGALEQLSMLSETDEYGKPKMSSRQRYDFLAQFPELKKYMQYDMSGNQIESGDYEAMTQAIWDRMEAEQQEMQSLYDAKEEAKTKYYEDITNANKVLTEIRDNQISLQEQVLSAIEEREQALIDKLSDERQQLSDAASDYIGGLKDALDKEREMYQRDQSASELIKLQRKLAILQRSGGSQTDIISLQKQVQEKNKEAYFDAQEAQINKIQEASDKQLEKMQTQIDIMTETLAFQKEHGLLQAEMNKIMQGSAESITAFITGNDPDWLGKTAEQQQKESKDILFSAQQWTTSIGQNPSNISDEEFYTVFPSATDAAEKAMAVVMAKEAEKEMQEVADAEYMNSIKDYASTNAPKGSITYNYVAKWNQQYKEDKLKKKKEQEAKKQAEAEAKAREESTKKYIQQQQAQQAQQTAESRSDTLKQYFLDEMSGNQNLISQIKVTLQSQVDSWNKLMPSTNKIDNSPTNINQQVEIVIEKLADGYDAKAAINDVFNALQDQARKSGNLTIKR